MPAVEVRRTYLALDAPSDFRPSPASARALHLTARPACSVGEYRALYHAVGAAWHWRDRDAWSDERLAAHLAAPEVTVHTAHVDGRTAGYVELQRHADGSVELVYLGLLPEFIGMGLGGVLLSRAVEEGWRLGAARIWLHTCTLDAPHALPNYLARGFRVTREETYTAQLPG